MASIRRSLLRRVRAGDSGRFGDAMTKMVEVTQEDANNYCRVLAALGMEEEGDPVAEIERLREALNIADGTLHRWRRAVGLAANRLEKARVWGGTEWHYNPLPPMFYRSAIDRLRDLLKA